MPCWARIRQHEGQERRLYCLSSPAPLHAPAPASCARVSRGQEGARCGSTLGACPIALASRRVRRSSAAPRKAQPLGGPVRKAQTPPAAIAGRRSNGQARRTPSGSSRPAAAGPPNGASRRRLAALPSRRSAPMPDTGSRAAGPWHSARRRRCMPAAALARRVRWAGTPSGAALDGRL